MLDFDSLHLLLYYLNNDQPDFEMGRLEILQPAHLFVAVVLFHPLLTCFFFPLVSVALQVAQVVPLHLPRVYHKLHLSSLQHIQVPKIEW